MPEIALHTVHLKMLNLSKYLLATCSGIMFYTVVLATKFES